MYPVYSCGGPVLKKGGPLFSRDGDDVIIKASLESGAPPFNISWTFNTKVRRFLLEAVTVAKM